MRGDLLTHSDSHILILINGRPFRELQEGDADNTFYKSFPLELIERIEIVRGPGSVLYGTNAVAGVINVITRPSSDPKDQPVNVKYSGGGGSFGTNLQSLTIDSKGSDWKMTLAYNGVYDQGWRYSAWTALPSGAPSYSYGETDYSQWNTSVTGLFDYNQRLNFQVFYANIQNQALGTLPYWANETAINSKRLFADLGFRQPVGEGWELKFNLTQNNYDKGITYETTGIREPDKSIDLLEEVSLSGAPWEQANLIVGVVNDERTSIDVIPTTPTQRDSIPGGFYGHTFSGYIQADSRFWSRLKLIAAGQYNRISGGAEDVVPRFGAIYDLTQTLGLKLQYSRAFRGPTAQETNAALANILQGNPNLYPEKVTTSDLQFFWNQASSQAALTMFNTSMENLIIRVPYSGSTQTFNNSGAKNIWGIELEGKSRLFEPFFLNGSATYQDEIDHTLYIPNYMIKGGLAVEWNPWTGGIFLSHFGKPHEISETASTGQPLNAEPGAIYLLSANVTYRFNTRLPVSVTVYGNNLLDDPLAYPEFSKGWINTLPIGPGRAVFAKVTIEN